MNPYYDYPYMDVWGDGRFLSGSKLFDMDKFIHSEAGKYLARARSLMTRYTGVDDPDLMKSWEQQGVNCLIRQVGDKRFLAFVPCCAGELGRAPYPVVLIFRPVGLLAEAFYEYFIDLAAQDQLIAIIYCSENPDENDAFMDMVADVEQDYPVDRTRIYTTGHSHYGELASEFTRRHHGEIAAEAQQGDSAGLILNFYGLTQEKLDLMHSYDMPLIDVAGTTEMVGIFPINQEAPGVVDDPHVRARFPITKEDRIASWQRRLYSQGCRVLSYEEIEAAGKNTVEKQLGFPVDHSDILFAEGSTCYIGDIKNEQGKEHFRMVAMENIPHTTCRMMHVFAWSFLKRFARDLETGEVMELY